MSLIKDNWTTHDVKDFLKYLYSFSRGEEKSMWEKRIVNTNLKCIAVNSKDVNSIIKQIKKGNYVSFIDTFLPCWDNLTLVHIMGKLICEIKEFDEFKSRLLIYSKKVDNWASCDCLKFRIKGKETEFLNLSNELIKSNLPFERRIGLGILFNKKEYLFDVFEALNNLKDEQNYYVNMMGAWLLAECMVIDKENTLNYFKNNTTNNFIINKAISKCCDSFRISTQDKDTLKTFRIKKNNE